MTLAVTATEQYKHRNVTTEESVERSSNLEISDEKSDNIYDGLDDVL
jgi:hypothetical protein